ncbi:MAG TPA: carboxypeptidase-like regulatory domain-containing protein, partial [Acidimicrobiia bacterium]|nr:carboxypeptidase-like regulatory domain-containing protein [Acidimicrobiia bacterium]
MAVFVMAVVAVPSFSGTTGKLSGKVVSEKNEPLAGVNVRVEGQRVGAITDDKGDYAIIGVLAGTYVVRANLLGYAAFAAQNVTIQPDFTTELNITLKSEAVQMEEVRVDAERPLLQKDATGTTRFITSDDMQKLPTRGYRDAAAQQTGVVNFQLNIDNEAQNAPTLIVRGGRPNETAYFVDGFSQQDPLTGTSSTSISNNAIEEVVLLTGGFSPEYGRIMSGAVNVITREGGAKYSGALEAVSDAIAGDWISAPVTDYNIYDVSLGGPLLPGYDKVTFYVSGERRWQRDRAPSHLPGQFQDALADLSLPNEFKPHNSSSGGTFQAKLAWQMTEQDQIKVGTLSSNEQWSQYLHSYLYNLDHAPRYED